ncbi:hypothetical protein M3Y96_00726300 [Aphelenchoides besseyi]|nr:hypothetical protein M3Y96_00726300 [Aphelenchoides besseyi]
MSNQTPKSNTSTYLESYPSLREPEPELFVIAFIFLSCFIVGICGNASTLTQILGFGTPKSTYFNRSSVSTPNRFLRIYVICLIVVDSVMLLGVPSSITESLIGFWLFGNYCKLHHLANCMGRIASNLMLTSMSVENYLILMKPQKYGNSRHTTGLLILMLGAVASSVLLLPVLIFANAQRVFLFESRNRGGQVIHIRIFRCVDGREQQKIVIDILAIALSRFVCWLPYWISVLYVSYVDLFESRTIKTLSNGSESTMVLLYCAHILPYINAALNWLFYKRIAKDIAAQFPLLAQQRNGLMETTSFMQNYADNQQLEVSWSKRTNNEENSLIFATSRVVCPNTTSDQIPSLKVSDSSTKTLLNLEFRKEIETFETL